MENCPFSGLPCFDQKCFRVLDIEKNKCVRETGLCMKCGLPYVEALHQPKVEKTIQVKKPEGVVEIPLAISGPIQAAPVIITTVDQLMQIFEGKGISVPKPEKEKEPCPCCGKTIAQFNTDGFMGCEHCYTHYHDEFVSLLGPFQEDEDRHVGKRPKHWIDRLPAEEKIRILKLKMAQAVEREKYEEASRLKAQIDELNGGECSSPR